jgi:hypothetical protein
VIDREPVTDDEQLVAALAALGVEDMRSADPARPLPHAWLLGALLLMVELQVRHDVTTPPERREVSAGYRWMLQRLAGGDTPDARRTWAVQLGERLGRTGEELREEEDGHADRLVTVARTASWAAANMLGLLHHVAPAPGDVAEVVRLTGQNLDAATRELDALRAELRGQGFDV